MGYLTNLERYYNESKNVVFRTREQKYEYEFNYMAKLFGRRFTTAFNQDNYNESRLQGGYSFESILMRYA